MAWVRAAGCGLPAHARRRLATMTSLGGRRGATVGACLLYSTYAWSIESAVSSLLAAAAAAAALRSPLAAAQQVRSAVQVARKPPVL